MSVQVIQDGVSLGTTAVNQLVSVPSLPVAAIVDRSADLDETARALVRARFSFGGGSPCGPDIVLVNEFTKKGLLRALVGATIAAGDAVDEEGGRMPKPRSRAGVLSGTIQNLRAAFGDSMHIVTEAACGVVVDVQERSLGLITNKVSGPVLVVCSIRSLDDAIDFLTRFCRPPYLLSVKC